MLVPVPSVIENIFAKHFYAYNLNNFGYAKITNFNIFLRCSSYNFFKSFNLNEV